MNLPVRPLPVPPNESARVEFLASLGVLDTPPRAEIDAIVALAARMMDAPVCLVSLLDADRIWFKARKGVDVMQAPREIAFCNHPVAEGRAFVIEDMTRDRRFRRHPLVTGQPHLRFYAGVPLTIASEFHIGALCILDHKPRSISPEQIDELEKLARIVATLIEHEANLRNRDSIVRLQTSQLRLIWDQRERIKTQVDLFDKAARLAKIGAWRLDPDSDQVVWSKQMYALHDVGPEFSPTRENVHSFFSPAVRKKVLKISTAAREKLSSWDIEVPMTSAAGVRKWIRLSGSYMMTPKGVLGIGIRQDISEQKANSRQLTRLACRDALTNLPNRHMFGELLGQAVEKFRKSDSPLALCFIDLDGFKHINDLYGHPAGDACLKVMARRMRRICNGAKHIARLGGDEFAIVLSGRDAENVIGEIVQPLIEAIREPVRVRSHTFHVSVSVGVSLRIGPRQPANVEDLQKEADLAMYAAKHAGKNTFRVYKKRYLEVASSRDQAARLIYSALAEDRIEFYYQPKVRLDDARIVGFEALVRCRTNDGRILAPGAFVSALDNADLSARIGEVAIDKCLRQGARWRAAGLPFGHIALNLSASQFRDEQFPDRLIDRIAHAGLMPQMVQVEITEGILLSHKANGILAALHRFRDAGISIAFDDFGTGFASLTHLLDFPVNCIKIDRSFVQEIGARERSQAIVRAIVSLAAAEHLKLDVIAEGIETPEERDFLASAGCKYGQGYLFARPLPAQDATDLLAAHAADQAPQPLALACSA